MGKGNDAFKKIIKVINNSNVLSKEEYKSFIEIKSELDELDFIKSFYKEQYKEMMKEKSKYEWALKELENTKNEK